MVSVARKRTVARTGTLPVTSFTLAKADASGGRYGLICFQLEKKILRNHVANSRQYAAELRFGLQPFINNITPNYQLPGFPPGTCQNVLEVGDVVEGTLNPSVPVTLNGFTYHPQTLGLLQWFEGITPSDAINFAYGFPGNNLTSPFMACPAP